MEIVNFFWRAYEGIKKFAVDFPRSSHCHVVTWSNLTVSQLNCSKIYDKNK